jgi:hypothetical protein
MMTPNQLEREFAKHEEMLRNFPIRRDQLHHPLWTIHEIRDVQVRVKKFEVKINFTEVLHQEVFYEL